MPRRCNDNTSEDDPPKKRHCVSGSYNHVRHGELLKDIAGKQWKLGKAVGVGGFGEIYLASDKLSKEVKADSEFVAKVESHKNGPLFVEVNCYLRIAKQEMIETWKRYNNMSCLGMPHYVASGSHIHKGERYRFLILPRFDRDLEKILQQRKILNLKTVLTISSQIIDVLKYIHSGGYIHADIKASNILLSNRKTRLENISTVQQLQKKYPVCNPMRSCRIQKRVRPCNLRPGTQICYSENGREFEEIVAIEDHMEKDFEERQCRRDQVYLLDYGLACKYLTSSGDHKPFCNDDRKAHAGTILFCSRDAHKGVASRRSDLESLGYNIIYWLTGSLPWAADVDDPEIVDKKKQRAMTDIEHFLRTTVFECPTFLVDYFRYLQNLQFQENPDYGYCKNLFKQCIKESGYKDDSLLDFENVQKCTSNKMKKKSSENLKGRKRMFKISRPPLQSNIPVKPSLRKEGKNKKARKRGDWFKILTDPEDILRRQAREKRTECGENVVPNVAELNIDRLNPTYAMMEVYNKCRGTNDLSHSGESCSENVEGYTPAMMAVLQKSRRARELEYERIVVNFNGRNHKSSKRSSKRQKKSESPGRSLGQIHTSKSTPVLLKKESSHNRKMKNVALRRTYSLRG